MLSKYLLVLIVLFSQVSIAFIPNILQLPELPMFGDFNPNQLRRNFNKFIGIEPDYAREARMVLQIEDAVLDGEVEYLTLKNKNQVFSIYIQSELDKSKGGVIILHNRGQHANWGDLIKPLRVGLAEKGWDTLSVQMPVLDKQAKYYDYVSIFPYAHERIEAAINFYKQLGIDNIILIGHSCGAHMSMSYIDKFGDDKFSAYVGIGMGATDYKQKMVKPFPLDKMHIPVLDVFSENDFASVIRLAKFRKVLVEATGNTHSAQLVIENAGHYYQEQGAAKNLTNQVGIWLDTL
ncbi:hypothetical protein Rmag_0376 [Candidatus Ruthia magnifica str. Cm (Calyptogena magnifica)]|uniref:DUF3530 family protein n=1 Tax=Ruthia magnifica subsp. Calyptogena magnifica TaxID=413404 RepID=A1AW39_RUTMC|nr:DUF3530 family protein [Candidatus Ruthturnera calyptogenae]ABL02146.1 hypothetical protein Rmag_0376 [Candidatus Ruthia magnifica str. Cm (Calyptogena magnifica)]